MFGPNETPAKKIGKFVIDTIQILHRIRKIICEKIQQKSQVENSAKFFLAKKSAKLRELSRAAEKASDNKLQFWPERLHSLKSVCLFGYCSLYKWGGGGVEGGYSQVYDEGAISAALFQCLH